MTKKGFRSVSLKDGTHARLTEVSNILGKTRPDAVKTLVENFLLHYYEHGRVKTSMEEATS